MTSGAYTLRWIVAWVVALTLLSLMARTRLGYNALYYLLWLALLLLFVTQYQRFAALLSPITGQ